MPTTMLILHYLPNFQFGHYKQYLEVILVVAAAASNGLYEPQVCCVILYMGIAAAVINIASIVVW